MLMMKLSHKFVKNIPKDIENGIIYISMEYSCAIHKCCCGCGNEVVTPIAPNKWKLSYNGEGVSLYPSIGNWSFNCHSHYWITDGQIEWASSFSKEQIEQCRERDNDFNSHIHRPILERILSFFGR